MSVLIDFASASAPASIGNVGVGFDILGQAFDAAHDVVHAVRETEHGVRLGEVSGLVSGLPTDPRSNTALAAASALLDAVKPGFGVRLSIEKGIPICAGMGGSAASAVAAAAATNALLGEPFSLEELLPFALEGERVASDPPHWDNVIASLFGGLVLAARESPALVQRVQAPDGIVAVLVHPEARIETRKARALLKLDVPLTTAIEHNRRAAAFFVGCTTNNLDLIRVGLEDVLIEPQRISLLPALSKVRSAGLEAGALGCSFSGSGPSIFAWVEEANSTLVVEAMTKTLLTAGIRSNAYVAPINSSGVRTWTTVEKASA
jgi:homoserine kinase